VGWFTFRKKTGVSQPSLSFDLFVIYLWSHDLEQVTSLSVHITTGCDVCRTPTV